MCTKKIQVVFLQETIISENKSMFNFKEMTQLNEIKKNVPTSQSESESSFWRDEFPGCKTIMEPKLYASLVWVRCAATMTATMPFGQSRESMSQKWSMC